MIPLGFRSIFLVLFITLGPIKLIGPFVRLAASASRNEKRRSALRVFALSTIIVLVVAFVGKQVAVQWGVSREAIMITIGSILFLWALLSLLEYRSPNLPNGNRSQLLADAVVFPLTIPVTITPAGIAAILLFSMRVAEGWWFLGVLTLLLLAVMLINLAAMLGAEIILKVIGGVVTLQIAGAILLVMQIALAVEVILTAVRELKETW